MPRTKQPAAERATQIRLTARELAIVVDALDSHIYWQLSDQHYRHSGFVYGPGSDDPEVAAAIARAEALLAKLEAQLTAPARTVTP